jgi:DNA (cytosine-5)-methyltransferase 1
MKPLIYGSLCSGIEAASMAWKPLGWRCAFTAEIEAFPSAVLAHHHGDAPNLGDMTRINPDGLERTDVVVAGTPCQSFSVAGLRKGLADPRGNLALDLLRIVDGARPEWLVWENVPGVLSSWSDAETSDPSEESRRLLEADGLDPDDFVEVEQTNDFDQFTSGIRELGYGLAWGSLDAQYFGLAQRRERVFVVAHLGDWTRAAAVLFDRESLSGNPAPSREAGAGVAGTLKACAGKSGTPNGAEEADRLIVAANNFGERDTATALSTKNQRLDADTETFVVHSLRADGFDASEDGTGRGTPLVPVAFNWQSGGDCRIEPREDQAHTLQRNQTQAIAFDTAQITSNVNRTRVAEGLPTSTLAARGTMHVAYGISSDALDRSGEGDGSAAERAGLGILEDKSPSLRARPNNAVAHVQLREVRSGDDGGTGHGGDQQGDGINAALPELHPIAFQTRIGRNGRGKPESIAPTLQGASAGATSDMRPCVSTGMAVRRLTPAECEALQGFPCGYTNITYRGKSAADGPRYRALGNSMAVPVMRWIGERIDLVRKAGAA